MHPILYGPIHWYGVMLALAFSAATLWAYYDAKRQGIDPDKILDLTIWIMVSAIVGGRILYVLSYMDEFKDHPSDIIFSRSGFSSYGGLILATIMGIWYLRRHHLPVWKVADIIMPAVALGEFIGRWGCFMNGCCYGRPANPHYVPWAIKFPYLDGILQTDPVYRHPTQIYQSIFALMIFFLLVSLNKRKKFDGETFWTYLIVYSIVRFIIDIFREPGQDWMFYQFTLAQLISIFLCAFSVGVLIRFKSMNIHNK